jgi:hypothetical protein
MSKKQHSESGRHRGERRKHDADKRHHEQDVYNEPEPNWIRYAIYALIGIVAVSFTLLFVGGFIKW